MEEAEVHDMNKLRDVMIETEREALVALSLRDKQIVNDEKRQKVREARAWLDKERKQRVQQQTSSSSRPRPAKASGMAYSFLQGGGGAAAKDVWLFRPSGLFERMHHVDAEQMLAEGTCHNRGTNCRCMYVCVCL